VCNARSEVRDISKVDWGEVTVLWREGKLRLLDNRKAAARMWEKIQENTIRREGPLVRL
jgi:hypothetical protein